jgi:hypothetical protein
MDGWVLRAFAAGDQPAVAALILGGLAEHWGDVVAFYLRCGFVLTQHVDGEFGRDAWFARTL